MSSRIAVDLTNVPKRLKNLRIDLRKIGHDKMEESDVEEIIDNLEGYQSLSKILTALLTWVKVTYLDDSFLDNTIPRGVRAFFRCIGSESAVCSYLPPTFQCMNLLNCLIEGNMKENTKKMDQLQEELPIFFNLVKDVGHLPLESHAMILHLMDISGKPFKQPLRQTPPSVMKDDVLCW